MTRVRVGLLVNPLAGVGGPLALKGSDDGGRIAAALAAGAARPAPARTAVALRALRPGVVARLELLTAPGAMGADLAAAAGLEHRVVGELPDGQPTTAADTRAIAVALVDAGVELLVFAGGDGTAVDVLHAVGERVPLLGLPAGVKMHSAVFARTPALVAAVIEAVVGGQAGEPVPAEVLDLDEEALREGRIAPRLHGAVRTPAVRGTLQAAKARSPASDAAAQAGIAAWLTEGLEPGRLVLLGPGGTVAAVAAALGVPKTVLGVDAVRDGAVVAADADEEQLFALAAEGPLVVLTPVGGQGFLLGRGNQQLSARVLQRAGVDALRVVATERKLADLAGAPLRVDTGDGPLDALLAGYRRVITGYGREAVYPVA